MLENLQFEVSSDFWAKVKSYAKVFKYFKKVMLIYQEKNLNLADFFLEWVNLTQIAEDLVIAGKNAFEKELAKLLSKAIDQRKDKIVNYPGNQPFIHLLAHFVIF